MLFGATIGVGMGGMGAPAPVGAPVGGAVGAGVGGCGVVGHGVGGGVGQKSFVSTDFTLFFQFTGNS